MPDTPALRVRMARKLRSFADRIDDDGAPRVMHWSFTFEPGKGIVFREDGKGCRIAYLGRESYIRAHTEADGGWKPLGPQTTSFNTEDQMTDDEIPIARVSISLPCSVPVLPGTPNTEAPIEERTERCAVDAWWIVGRASICNLHLRAIFPTTEVEDVILSPIEEMEWEDMHRYEQEQADPGWGQAINSSEVPRRMAEALKPKAIF